jgi:hypothetical protein
VNNFVNLKNAKTKPIAPKAAAVSQNSGEFRFYFSKTSA